jgi:hypothetical protein
VAQHVHVIDAVRPGGHPGNEAARFQVRVHPGPATGPDMPADQGRQAAPFGQGQQRDQAEPRHEIRSPNNACVRAGLWDNRIWQVLLDPG